MKEEPCGVGVGDYIHRQDTTDKDDSNNNKEKVSYWELVSTNREFRLLLSSYLISHCGEWLTYIATIDFIEDQSSSLSSSDEDESQHRTLISILVVIRLLPNVLFSAVGGSLADAFDKRYTMILLDVCGAMSAMLFIVAYHLRSILLMYVATFVQECIAGLYQPCFSSMLPMTTLNDQQLQKGTTLSGIVWSSMVMIGSSLGGFLVASVGSNNCYRKYDFELLLLSSLFLLCILNETDRNVQTHNGCFLYVLDDVCTWH